ncbi:MAG: PQQ-binding-like beta-propeller repeat protein [Thermoanaerobaculales bacterium]
MRKTTLVGVVCQVLGIVATISCSGEALASLDGRKLPSLDIVWQAEGRRFAVHENTVFVLGDHHVEAIDAADGTVRWRVELESKNRRCDHIVAIGDAVAVGCGRFLFVVDPATGKIRARRDIGMLILGVHGPPLVVHASNGAPLTQIIGIDPETGADRGTWRAPGAVVDEVFVDGVLLVRWMDLLADGSPSGIAAIDGSSLQTLWEIDDDRARLKRLGRDVLVLRRGSCEDGDNVRPLNHLTGELGEALPPRDEVIGAWNPDNPWELQGFNRSEDRSNVLRRNDPGTGEAVWVVEIPGHPSATLIDGDRLFVHAEPAAGRGFLVVIDWASGEVMDVAYGLYDVRRLEAIGDLLVAETVDTGVVAFSRAEFGSPEGETSSVESEVKRILQEINRHRYYNLDDGVAELRSLGESAYPHVADEIPGLGPLALTAAAEVIAATSFVDGAEPLAARLTDQFPRRDGYSPDPVVAVLHALAVIGSCDQTDAIIPIVTDPIASGERRLAALAALASIGGTAAEQAIANVLEPNRNPKISWWHPPDASQLIPLAGKPTDWDAIDAATDVRDLGARARFEIGGRSARVSDGKGGELIVFPDAALGGDGDLWVATVDSENRAGPSRFLGISMRNEFDTEPLAVDVRVEGDTLVVWPRGERDKLHRVGLAELLRDTDGDGLSDVVESRIRTNPQISDTDGDGLADGVDPAPNARKHEAESVEEEIALAVFRQINMFETDSREDGELALVVNHPAVEWRGRAGPTVTLSKEEYEAFREEAGFEGSPRFFILVGGKDLAQKAIEGVEAGELQELVSGMATNDRACSLEVVRGRRSAVGYLVIIRPFGGLWAIRHIELLWVS